MSRRISILIFLCTFWSGAYAQEISVKGHFLADTSRIGERIPYALSVHYPAAESLVFPDSTFSFTPFEIERKISFPTQTKDGISRDSAIYLLTTFELDSILSLALPVFIIHPGDCTVLFSDHDTIIIKHLVASVPTSVAAKDLPLKANADYMPVAWMLNYPLILIIAAVFLVILIILWIIFGKQIRKYFQLKRLLKNHTAFLKRLSFHVDEIQKTNSTAGAESILVDWKNYMETLVSVPYTKFTSKEILRLSNDETLRHALRSIDRMVYARENSVSVEAFDGLRTFTQAQFSKKTEEVKHG